MEADPHPPLARNLHRFAMRGPVVALVLLASCARTPAKASRVVVVPEVHGTSTPARAHGSVNAFPAFRWSVRDLPMSFDLVAAAGHGVVYVGGGNILLRSIDGGRSFVDVKVEVPGVLPDPNHDDDGSTVGIWAHGDRVYVATGYHLLGSTDQGRHWSSLAAPMLPNAPAGVPSPIKAVWGEGNDLYFVTLVGEVHHSPDRGKTWHVWNSNTGGAFLGMAGNATGTLAVIGCFGYFFRSDDRGDHWVRKTPPPLDYQHNCPTQVAVSTRGHFLVVFKHQLFIHADDGTGWRPVRSGIEPDSAAAGPRGDWTVVGSDVTTASRTPSCVARSFDDGFSWHLERMSLAAPAAYVAGVFRDGFIDLTQVARIGREAYALGVRTTRDGMNSDEGHAVFAVARPVTSNAAAR